MNGEQRMLAAARRQLVDVTPVWFMRQAGRCLAEYRELRKRYDILTLAKTPDLCARVSLMPIAAFDVDAAVMFADIMLPIEGMGVSLEIEPEIGPIIHNPVRSQTDVDRLRVIDPEEDVPFVLEAVRLVRRELDGKRAVIGFSGAPYTLACYLIEGRPSRDYIQAKTMMFGHPAVWHGLMEKLTEVVIRYLRAQIGAGAQIVQLFDSWVGGLNPRDYTEYVLPYSRRIFGALSDLNVPRIHFGTSTGGLLELMAAAGPDVVSVDWRLNLDEAWARIGYDKGVQGNLDSMRPLGGWEALRFGMRDVLARAGGRPGHIFNLGHGVYPGTDPDLLRRLVDAVREETAFAGAAGKRHA